MAWHYVLDGVSQGPVAEAELQSLHQRHIVTLDTPVWTEGMTAWVPFQQCALAPAVSAAAPPALTHACAECQKSFREEDMLQYENSWVCAACKPVFFQRIREGVQPQGSFEYASVGRRFVAILLDGIIMMFVVMVPLIVVSVIMAVAKGSDPNSAPPAWFFVIVLLVYCLPPVYEIYFIGRFGATLGKMLMKIKVVAPDGGKISYGKSTGRYFAKILSGMILYIGFLMAFWDEQKRALHDQICRTRVIVTQPS
jgi:uncharacterized RDD family membrane protein YckC